MALPPPIDPSSLTHVGGLKEPLIEAPSPSPTQTTSQASPSLGLNETHALHEGIAVNTARAAPEGEGHIGQAIARSSPVLAKAASSLRLVDETLSEASRPIQSPEQAKTLLEKAITTLTRASSDVQEAHLSLAHFSEAVSSGQEKSSQLEPSSVLSLATTPTPSSHTPPSLHGLSQSTGQATTGHATQGHAAHGESIGIEIAENMESGLKFLGAILRKAESVEEAREKALEHAEGHGATKETSEAPSALSIASAAISGVENVLSVGLLAHQGVHLHKLRMERKDVHKQLQEKLETLESSQKPASAPSLKDQAISGLSKLFGKGKPENAPTVQESPVLDPEIAKLQNRLDHLDKELQKAGTRMATSTLSTSIGLAHMGVEVAKFAVGESLAVAAAGSGLLIGGSLIGLALSTKGIYDNTKTLLQAKNDLKETQDPALKEQLEAKITQAKVGISRGTISAIASSLGIASTGMGIAAAVGVAGLSTAIAATGFGALALAGVALLVGVSYLVYRHREAIGQFFEKATDGLVNMIKNLAQGMQVCKDQSVAKVEGRLDDLSQEVRVHHETQLISDSSRASAEMMRKTLEKEQERARVQEDAMRNLRLMFSAPAK